MEPNLGPAYVNVHVSLHISKINSKPNWLEDLNIRRYLYISVD